MHELSIAESIIDIVRQYVPEDELTLVRTVRVEIGAQAGISPEALEFGYRALVSESALRASALGIEDVPYRLRCQACDVVFVSEDGLVVCPACSNLRCTVLSGTEMRVVDIQLADEADR